MTRKLPTRFVLDASALVKRIVDEDDSADLRAWIDRQALAGAELDAPHLLPFETAQVLADRGLARPGQDEPLRPWVLDLVEGVRLHACAHEGGPFLGRLSAYDASYLALASRLQATLVTYDRRLAKVAQTHGVAVVSPGRSP